MYQLLEFNLMNQITINFEVRLYFVNFNLKNNKDIYIFDSSFFFFFCLIFQKFLYFLILNHFIFSFFKLKNLHYMI